MAFVLVAVLIGIVIGFGHSFWSPDGPSTKETAVLWIGLMGDLFIRSLKCICSSFGLCVNCSLYMSHGLLCLVNTGRIVGVTIGTYGKL